MNILIACILPIAVILFAMAVEGSIVVGVLAIVALLVYVIIKKTEANQKAKEWKDEIFK